MSFADPERPCGEQALGIAVVEADDGGEAVQRAWELDCNPGGEVLGYELPDDALPACENRNRLLSPGEARELMAALDRMAGEG